MTIPSTIDDGSRSSRYKVIIYYQLYFVYQAVSHAAAVCVLCVICGIVDQLHLQVATQLNSTQPDITDAGVNTSISASMYPTFKKNIIKL